MGISQTYAPPRIKSNVPSPVPIGVSDLSHVTVRPVPIRASDSSDVNENQERHDKPGDAFQEVFPQDDSFRTAIAEEVRILTNVPKSNMELFPCVES